MTKRLLGLLLLLPAVTASAITFRFGEFDSDTRTCALIGWEGEQPAADELVEIPEIAVADGVEYTVDKIASGALDNFTDLTQIRISRNIVEIGDNMGYTVVSCENFRNCPNLREILVAGGNPKFSSSQEGCLMSNKGHTLVRVPEGIDTGGELRLSEDIIDICPEAFAGVSAVRSLVFPAELCRPNSNMGIDGMSNLEQISFTTDSPGELAIADNVLYTKDMTQMIAYPPMREGSDFTVPEGVTQICDRAMANASLLRNLNVGNVDKFGNDALSGSGITSFSLPYRDVKLGEGMLRGCQNLGSILLPRKVKVPRNFARGSRALEQVLILDVGNELADNAFRGCSSLTSFNFNANNYLVGDSIFAECGFKEVVFAPGEAPAEGCDMGDAIFYGCPSLELIDMSGVLTHKDAGMDIGLSFAASCRSLKRVRFPRISIFWCSSAGEYHPALGVDPTVEIVEIGAFTIANPTGAPLMYTHPGPVPSVYCKTTDAAYRTWPLTIFFHVPQGFGFHPQIYCDNYSMKHPDVNWYDQPNQYVYPGATYYVPAFARGNYSAATEAGCEVLEMFGLELLKFNGKFAVRGTPGAVSDFALTAVYVDESYSPYDELAGFFVSQVDAGMAATLRVEYTVNGVSMATEYDVREITSAVTNVEADGTARIMQNGNTISFSGKAAYTVHTLSGARIMSGEGNEVSLSHLSAGSYVVTATHDDGQRVSRKIIL